jgi:Aspartyl protease
VKSLFCLAAVAVAQLVVPAHAADCGPLVSYGSIALTQIDGRGSDFVPVEIAGTPKLMVLDTGAGVSTITSATVNELHLKTGPAPSGIQIYDVTGARSLLSVTAPLKIGNLGGGNLGFMLSPASIDDFGDARVAGLLGFDILGNYDISIDYGANTLTMVSPKHCEGRVVYWPERPIAVIPFRLEGGAAIVLPVTLDGHEIKAQLDTGASRSTLEKSLAERAYGIVTGSADTPALGDLNGKNGLTIWTHRFKTLSLGGVDVSSPQIDIIPDKISKNINTWSTGSMLDKQANSVELPTMLLGMNVLRRLHIYIAYREKKLYITPASQPAAASAPAAAAPPAPAPSSVHG